MSRWLLPALLALFLVGMVFSDVGANRDSPLPVVPTDSMQTAKTINRVDTVLVVKHQFNHRQQIITGSVIMACLAGVLVVMNNYNPR